MRVLLDTHVLVWAVARQERLPQTVANLLNDSEIETYFSVINIWEIAIKTGLGRAEFQIDPRRVRRALLNSGYQELNVTGAHAEAIGDLPPIHKDPFDRMLIAQATVEGMDLLTSDTRFAAYPRPIRYFG